MQVVVSSIHTGVTNKQKSYINKKIGNLDKYLPRRHRSEPRAEVRIKEVEAKRQKGLICEVSLKLPKETLIISETNVNLYVAVNIIEAKLKLGLKKYKDTHYSPKSRQKIARRLRWNPGTTL
ncbi:MAG: HPF/RaiA family ribosome-associated protein [Candidatus Saccharimonadales bacterium]